MKNNMGIQYMMYFYIGLIIFLLLVFLFSILSKTRTSNYNHYQNKIKELNKEIQEKEIELRKLHMMVINNTVDNTVYLSQVANDVLDMYQQTNIRIPADIIEDLTTLKFATHKETFDYIENQRHFWKLENSKKPYKKL